jgi:integrase
MPAQERYPAGYPGVYFIVSKPGTPKEDKIYYIDYRIDGKRIQEKAGYHSKGMSPAKANNLRADRMRGKEPSNKERRETEKEAKAAEDGRWTLEKLWTEYKTAKPDLKGWKTGTYDSQWSHIEGPFGKKEPHEILSLDVKRLENQLKKTKSPQTVKHVLKLLRILCNFGADNGLCPGLSFKIKMPVVDNSKTEDLTPDQIKKLLEAIEADDHMQAGDMMLMALYTGMRRGEMFRLKWSDIDFDRGFIRLVDPKGGIDQTIPLNDAARGMLEKHPKRNGSPFVFPGRGGEQRTRIEKACNHIKKAAGLPKGFRPLHGLRHVYASMLASSGKVDMYVLQKLLTHKSPQMTQRYAHLRDESLKRAADVAGDIVAAISGEKDKNGTIALKKT